MDYSVPATVGSPGDPQPEKERRTMVAPARPDQGIEIGLKSLRLMLDDLPEVARDWPQMSDAERASWSLDWDQVIGGEVRLLERQRRSDQIGRASCRERV